MQKNLHRILGATFLFAILWWAFSEGSVYQLWLGIVIVVIANVVSRAVPVQKRSSIHLNLLVLWKFIGYFVYESLKGGFYVARLAFLPRHYMHSMYFEYSMSIPRESEAARMVFASCLCVFPGTLSCGYKGDVLVIHVLDTKLLDVPAVRKLEEISARLFRLDFEKHETAPAN